ncbi:hypothetical protein VPH35_009702 [Triticum aestivum]
MLRRLAGAIAAPLRRSLCTAASRPPWALTYRMAPLGARGAPPSLDLHKPPCVSQLSVPAHLADDMDLAAVSIQAASCDGLLLLDFAGTLRSPEGTRDYYGPGVAAFEPGVRRFVCNPLSGQLFHLPVPVPSMDAERTTTPFGLLTRSDGPPDRVVRRFRSETGEWDEPPLCVPATAPVWGAMPNHEVVAFGDRLWWVDPYIGVFSVDPFSDRPEHVFGVLPRPLPNFAIEECPALFQLLGVSEGKLRYVKMTTKEPIMFYSFSLDDDRSSWKLTHETRFNIVKPDKSIPMECEMPWISAIDPFNANVLYLQFGGSIYEFDMAMGGITGRSSFTDSITSPHDGFVPVMLPRCRESYNMPCAGTLSSKTEANSYRPESGEEQKQNANCTRKTLADMLIPYNGPTTELVVVLEDMNSHFWGILGQSWCVPFADALSEQCSWRTH